MTVTKICHKCGQGGLVVRRTTNDIMIWYCPACKCNAAADKAVIPFTLIQKWQEANRFPGNLDLIPVAEIAGVCAKCGAEDTVLPYTLIPYQLREFVDDYDEWPALPLCLNCTSVLFKVAFWYMPEGDKKDGVAAKVGAKYAVTA